MEIKTTKTFASYCNNLAKKAGAEFHAEIVSITEAQYFRIFPAAFPGLDYNAKTGKYNALLISYPWHYYSNPAYMDTATLCKEFRRRGCKNAADLDKMLLDLFCI